MDFSQTMPLDTDYVFGPFLHMPDYNETKFYGRREADGSYSGFTYSNVSISDSATLVPYTHIAAYPASGAEGTAQYAVVHGQGAMLEDLIFGVKPSFAGTVFRVYVTNAVKTVWSMEHGDSTSKKFGGATGTDPDWLLLTVRAYHFDDSTRIDSLSFYLADFRSNDPAEDYIVKDWRIFELSSLGRVDSLTFSLTSSDTDSNGAMRTPYYFCLDNFDVEIIASTNDREMPSLPVSVYPNPVSGMLYLDMPVKANVALHDISGRRLLQQDRCRMLDVSGLLPGLYFVSAYDPVSKRRGIQRFVKK